MAARKRKYAVNITDPRISELGFTIHLFSPRWKKRNGRTARVSRSYRILYRIRIRLAGLHYGNPATFRRYRVHFLISV